MAGFDASTDVVMGFYRPIRAAGSNGCSPVSTCPTPARWTRAVHAVIAVGRVHQATHGRRRAGTRSGCPSARTCTSTSACSTPGCAARSCPTRSVKWRLRPDVRSCLRQYYRYGQGDGRAGMYPRRHALRFATYAVAALMVALSVRQPAVLALLGAGIVIRMLSAYRRAFRRLPATEKVLALVALPVLEVLLDIAKMAGWVSGRVSRPAARARRRSRGAGSRSSPHRSRGSWRRGRSGSRASRRRTRSRRRSAWPHASR